MTTAIGGFALRVEPPVAVVIALLLDGILGEPPEPVHPVALFGRAIAFLDRAWPMPRLAGLSIALIAPLTVAGLAWTVITAMPSIPSTVLASLLLFSTISLRRLLASGRTVITASKDDVEAARDRIPALVGRNPASLSPAQLRSGAVESLAENLADGFVAPLVAFVVGAQLSMSIGIAAAVWVKAVNTLDSMLGYHEKPIGWASARLDDLVMWIPARVTALFIAVAGFTPGALWRARHWLNAPPSPNSGWPMATLATVLDVRLEKPGSYVLNPEAPLPNMEVATRAIRVVAVGGGLAGAMAVVVVSIPIVPDAIGPLAARMGIC